MIAPARILLVFGTRPEAIKLLPVHAALHVDPRFDPLVCVSGQHRDMLDQVLAIAHMEPDFDLNLMRPDQSLDALTAGLLTGLGGVMDKVQPARVVVQGDTATAMAGALAAYYRRIPVDHVEAGLRSGDILHPWPEEVNRKVIATMASLHFAPTPVARDALISEGIAPERVHLTGNTVIDALHWVNGRIADRPELAGGLDALAVRFAGKRIIGVTCHRRENHGEGLEAIAAAIAEIACRPDVAVIFPVHPNPNVRGVMHSALGGRDNVALIEPLDYPHFVRLLGLVDLMLTDSGGVQEEAPAFGKPVLVMRETTERPEGVAAGTARLVGTHRARIVAAVNQLLEDPLAYQRMARAHNPFGDGRAAHRIVELIGHEIGKRA